MAIIKAQSEKFSTSYTSGCKTGTENDQNQSQGLMDNMDVYDKGKSDAWTWLQIQTSG